MNCLRCNTELSSIGIQKLQLGESGVFVGVWSNIFSGALDVEIYICEKCGKMEFYSPYIHEIEDKIEQQSCPFCGKPHEIDDVKCPHCKQRLQELY